ncbi:serine hydrolase domain-containing protein [Marinicella litoralis]|uniref:CubicO group peptidase (Beta-lactamase class C family) n=1 Tax=Marinicella litoralis TaxID=644220 RepID=A0A4R6XF33_9GAMM|nr:serine hydrolase domain-containing protein [Marinicella litoralis]TDR16370.1 CubicO group peptidase (beta-lactamase class C family) [Marinicella litoralis]
MNSKYLSLLLLMLSPSVWATKTQEKAVDEIFSEWDKANMPGASLGVFQNGKIIYARGYGMANLEYDIPNDANSVFRIGSTSKQFTAACIVLLAEQGKLKLTDSLHSFFPAFPDYAKEITVRHLLNHTSGVRDYLTLSFLKGLTDEDYYEDKDVMQWLTNQTALNFAPGEEYIYSNSGYWLLGQIVKQVTQMDMAEFAAKELFEPLGMYHTHFHNNHKAIVKNRASGYAPKEAGGYQISMTTLNMIGDGGIFTTISDIKKWDDAFYNSEVLSKKFWQAMITQGKLNNGKQIEYASGLIIEPYKGLNAISHGGAFVGFRAELLRFPDQKFTVAVFANRSDANPTSMAFKVAEVFLEEEFKTAAQVKDSSESNADIAGNDEAATQLAAVPLEQLTGEYQLNPGIQLTVSIQSGTLHGYQIWNQKEYDFEPIENAVNTFKIVGDDTFSFEFDDFENNQAQVINLSRNGSMSAWNRVDIVDTSGVELSGFVGDYYSKELDVVYQVTFKDDALFIQVDNNAPEALAVLAIDQLSYDGIVLDFVRQEGVITGFIMSAGRVKNLVFGKQ